MKRDTPINFKRPNFLRDTLAYYGAKVVIIVSILVYLAIYTHVPISLQLYQTYDDALFIKLGQSIANGHWLGSFNQLTLAKGAGYPLFLSVSSWLGTSITFSQAIFYCLSTLAFSYLIHKMTGSKIAALAIFVLVLFNPNGFQDRVLRESIYTSQILAIICLCWLALLADKQIQVKRRWAIIAGLMLGWFWITREEGIWIIPGLSVIFLMKLLKERNEEQPHRETLVRLGFFTIAFLFVLLLLRCCNFMAYHAFVGVDIKDPSFVSAMQQLQRTHAGPEIPYIPVSKETRERLYGLSPLFAVLKPTLDPSVGVNPSVGSECWIWPTACHDLSAGQLLWQIRNGAATAGKYANEKDARKYFRDLSIQLATICEMREIPCYAASPIPMMPHLSAIQWRSIGASLIGAWNIILQERNYGWLDAPPSNGDDKALHDAKLFLNSPLSTPVSSINSKLDRTIVFHGWFLEKRDGWFRIDAPVDTEVKINRLNSPDIARLFPGADKQRFSIAFQCSNNCRMRFLSGNGDEYVYNPESPPPINKAIHYGGAVIAFDSITTQDAANLNSERTVAAVPKMVRKARKTREFLYRAYSKIVPSTLYFGMLAILIALTFFPRPFLASTEFSLSLPIVVIVISRVVILVLINISSFPALTQSYFSPVLFLIPVWSVLSISGAIRTAINRWNSPPGVSVMDPALSA